jgi:hypothetical protein
MSSVKISQLPTLFGLSDPDLFPVVSNGITFNVTSSTIQNYIRNFPSSISVNSINSQTAIVNGGGNGVGNIGTTDTRFNTVFARATSALYADLAECYASDADYATGTVISLGGPAEVTASNRDADSAVIGVVSENPAYVMNSGLESEHVATVALIGRIPCLVQGPIQRGQMLVSAGNGRARAEPNPAMGTVIGKAMQDHADGPGVIEIIVGKL